MTISKMLLGHDLFRSLQIEEVDLISKISSTKTLKKDDVVFKYNGVGSHVFLVIEGQVHLSLPAGPNEFSLVVAKSDKGELFGLSPLLGSERYTLGARCATDTTLMAIEAKRFREILQSNCIAGFMAMSSVARIYFERYIEVMKKMQDVVNQLPLIR